MTNIVELVGKLARLAKLVSMDPVAVHKGKRIVPALAWIPTKTQSTVALATTLVSLGKAVPLESALRNARAVKSIVEAPVWMSKVTTTTVVAVGMLVPKGKHACLGNASVAKGKRIAPERVSIRNKTRLTVVLAVKLASQPKPATKVCARQIALVAQRLVAVLVWIHNKTTTTAVLVEPSVPA